MATYSPPETDPVAAPAATGHIVDAALDGGPHGLPALSDGHTWVRAGAAVVSQPAAASGRYVHDQAAASATWTISHNLGAIPSAVAIVDTAGTVVYGTIVNVNVNTLSLLFSAPFSGKAYVGL